MKKLGFSLVLLAGVAAVSDTVALACGSKFLVSIRSPRYQRMLANLEPTSILIYWKQDAGTPDEDRWDPKAEKAMEMVGHTVEVTFDHERFRDAADSGNYEVVIMMLGEARALKGEVESLYPTAALLPIAHFPTRSEYSQAKREFGTVFKTPSTTRKSLTTIEKARKSR